jgi:isopenicillin-N epimerase
VEFFVRRLTSRHDAAREELAAFLDADPEGLVAVPNATTGVNAVLRSLDLAPGDELLTTDHAYNACRNALNYVAERTRARVTVVSLPFDVPSPEAIVEPILAAVTEKTRLALLDHVTSATGMILPLRTLVDRLREANVECLVDGAHAPGMLPLSLKTIGAAYYVGNCHKWICAPKGAAFLHVRSDRREPVRPLTISHGANSPRPGRSRFHDEFDWMGTDDPTAFLCVPTALRFMDSLLEGGWSEIMIRNRDQALEARRRLADTLDVDLPCPDEMIGSLAALPLPDGSPTPPKSALYTDPLQDRLLAEYRIEGPVVPWPAPPKRLIRISAQLYNTRAQYTRLCEALPKLL